MRPTVPAALAALLLIGGGAAGCGGAGASQDQSVSVPPVTASDSFSATSLASTTTAAGDSTAVDFVSSSRTDGTVHRVGTPGKLWVWATIDQRVIVRRQPTSSSAKLAKLTTTTPEGTAANVQILATQTLHGATWLRVSFPSLPNGRTGWVPRSALGGFNLVNTQLTINRERLTATLRRSGRIVFRARIGVGRAATPTPAGSFYIRNKLAGFNGAPVYGPIAFGTSARSAVLTDWPAGGYVGIHGTNQPNLIPGRISHGCVRLRNADILRLAKLMPVGSSVRVV